MSNFKHLRDYLAPQFEVVTLNCEAGFSASLENLLDNNDWAWDEQTPAV